MKNVFRGSLTPSGRTEGSKSFHSAMEQARAMLDERFGLKLVEFPGKQKSYILVSKFEEKLVPANKQLCDDSEHAQRGLVVFILSAIFMRGGSIGEEELCSFSGCLINIRPFHGVSSIFASHQF